MAAAAVLALMAAGPAGAAAAEAAASSGAPFPDLPLPPEIEPPTEAAFLAPPGRPRGRKLYLDLVRSEAERHGLPAEVADAVAQVESAYDPNAVGGVGEIGLMQVRPSTASMLGFRGPPAKLFEPEVNVRYGVTYLAQAWRLTGGQLCQALMKYRAGHGEERMTERSVAYCLRARVHLAAIGSPLAAAPMPPAIAAAAAGPRPRVAGRMRNAVRRAMWAAHDRRMKAIQSKITASTLMIMR